MTDTRCVCGYARSLHEPAGHCPLCACGKLPAEHEQVVENDKLLAVCPGKPRSEAGKLPTLRRGSFRELAPAGAVREWFGMLVPVVEAEREVEVAPALPPRVPARLTVAESEIAPRARPLGTAAADLGWRVVPWYWQAGDGTETSALLMRRDSLFAVAYWHRAPGASWKTGGARAWRDGQWPREVTITALRNYIDELGASA